MIDLIDIPFSQFQKFLVKNDRSIFPEGTTDEHIESLLEEFRVLTSSKKGNAIGLAEGNMLYYTLGITELQIYLDALNEKYIPEICDLIRSKGFEYPLTQETYQQDIVSIASDAQQWDVKRLEYETTVKAITPKDVGEITFEYYADCTNAISTMIGGNVPDDINTRRWGRYFNQLIQNIEKSRQPNGQSGKNR